MRARQLMVHCAVGCFVLGAGALLAACDGDPAAPVAEDVLILVQVTGGFGGVNYAYVVDGADLEAREISNCWDGCDPGDGEVAAQLTTAQVQSIARMFRVTFAYDGEDFGHECCDAHYYIITYREGERTATVRGAGGTLPARVNAALTAVFPLFQGATPIIVDFESQPEDWPQDALTLTRYSLEGHVLELDVQYGGGCREHDLDLVAWGGFLESLPVQVNVLLSHDAQDDACEALIMRTLRFDLVPLKDEYVAPHRDGGPGATTIVLRVTVPDGEGPRQIEYTF